MSSIRVEVVRARRDGVDTVTVQLPAGASVRDALRASGIAAEARRDIGAWDTYLLAAASGALGDPEFGAHIRRELCEKRDA